VGLCFSTHGLLLADGARKKKQRRKIETNNRSYVTHSGTSSIVDEKTHEPLLSILTSIVETAVKLRKDGHKVIIVSSGAIGVGLRRMDVEKRPKHLSKLQVGEEIVKYRHIKRVASHMCESNRPSQRLANVG
jgi:glutamate 5-kinase